MVLPRFFTISDTITACSSHMRPAASAATWPEFLSMTALRSAGRLSYFGLFMARMKVAV